MADVTKTIANIRPLIPADVVNGLAGGAGYVGEVFRLNSSEVWVQAQASTPTGANGLLGLCVADTTRRTDGAVAFGDRISLVLIGEVTGFTGLNGGTKYYLSDTAGAIADAAGTDKRFIGLAKDATTLWFNPVGEAAS